MSEQTSKLLLSKLTSVIQRHKLSFGRDFLIDVIHAAQELYVEFLAILIAGIPEEAREQAVIDQTMSFEHLLKERLAVLARRKEKKDSSGIVLLKP